MNAPTEAGIRTVGLLGGVGSGKSTVARFLAKILPGRLIDADAEVGHLLENLEISQKIELLLGPGLLLPNNKINRAKLGEAVFGNPAMRKKLENLLHPAVRDAVHQQLDELEESHNDWGILDIPLLMENGLSTICDFLVFVDTPEADRRTRACERHRWTAKEWKARELAQADLDTKQTAADAILVNVGSLEDLKSATGDLLPLLCELPPRPLRDRWPQ